MKNITKAIIFAALTSYSVSAFSQARETMPAAANSQPTQPVDYGKLAETLKVKKHIISFGFFSPLNSHISFGYDQLFGTDIVFTSQLGIIGPGINSATNTEKPIGAFVEAGVKLFFSPDFVTIGTMRYNSMQGWYFKPQLIVSSFQLTQINYNNSYSYYGGTTTSQNQYTGVAAMLNIGKQWILANCVSLDMYAGIGYCITSNNNSNDYISNYFSFESSGSSPLSFTAGLNIGVPF